MNCKNNLDVTRAREIFRAGFAEAEFIEYDFGDGVQVLDHNGWETGGDAKYSKCVFLQYDDDAPDADSHKATFHVHFKADGTVEDAYALEVGSGNRIGQRKAANRRLIIAVFQPQALVNDCVSDIDGVTSFDATGAILRMSLEDIHALRDATESSELVFHSSETDIQHQGPFTVRVVASIEDFFGVPCLTDITGEMLEQARARFPEKMHLPESKVFKRQLLKPSGRFIIDDQDRKVAEIFQPGDTPLEQEHFKRRIVGSFNVLPSLIGVLLRADEQGSLWQALSNEGITDSYEAALSDAVKALGEEGIATVAHLYELDPETIRAKMQE
ncbi:hypothetical protein [Paraburkholderia sp. J8-2]|uniref:hypothetical protein n=1 Tax=Paraburkholderia sp. J8-2 TaxID=2805440 RepID=UPI002AB6A909|nr:hypothetical protein [Paraburkholderia sp. J8-2]